MEVREEGGPCRSAPKPSSLPSLPYHRQCIPKLRREEPRLPAASCILRMCRWTVYRAKKWQSMGSENKTEGQGELCTLSPSSVIMLLMFSNKDEDSYPPCTALAATTSHLNNRGPCSYHPSTFKSTRAYALWPDDRSNVQV